MTFREARTSDIPQLQFIRQRVTQNVLSDPSKVTEYDYLRYLTIDGKGWVCEVGNIVVGFGIVDTRHKMIWALFVSPGYEAKGVGKVLLERMTNWYFEKESHTLSLHTWPGTRAEQFYQLQGWSATGKTTNGEIIFKLEHRKWKAAFDARNN